MSCGRIIEFQYPLARVVRKVVPEARDFEITGTETRITGYCADCRRGKE
jgi:Fe2+ or Zn2+ uptake regulation protein